MNHLNSLLIEGTMVNDPEIVEKDNRQVCTFKLVSTRYALIGGEKTRELSFFDIQVHNHHELEKCKELSRGRGVRVVGRMTTEAIHDRGGVEHHKTIIISESVSIKPQFDHKQEEVKE